MPDNLCVAIIQGRMGSSRLPGKVLLDIAGKPMLQHVIERTRRAQSLAAVVVATSSDPADDPIAAFCAALSVPCARGSLHDVLDRYYQAAQEQQAKVVVRITADCPAIDPDLIDETVRLVTEPPSGHPVDFATNRLPPPFGRSFPIGLDVEVCTFAALQRAWQEAAETFQREHVMPFIYEGFTPETGLSARGFKIALLNHAPDYGSQRWTVDTPEDLEFVRQLLGYLKDKIDFTWYDVLTVVQKHPELVEINAGVRHKFMKEIDPRSTKSVQ